MWFLLEKCSKKPSLPLLFTGNFPKIKRCWQKGLLNTLEYVSHWVCRLSALLAEALQDIQWPVVGWATASSWGMLEVSCGPSTSNWGCSSVRSSQGYCSAEESRNGTGPAWNLTARFMLWVDGGWKTTISGLVPKVQCVGNPSVLQKVLYMFYLFPSFGCCQHQVGHLDKKALKPPNLGSLYPQWHECCGW